MSKSKIEWCDSTWNPVRGCSLVSEGCRNCYAMKQAHRFSGPGMPYEGLTELGPSGPRWTGKVRLVPELLDAPLRLRKPQRIFVNSMSDLFHEDVPDEFIAAVFAMMNAAPLHTFQILTKRPRRMAAWFSWLNAFGGIGPYIRSVRIDGDRTVPNYFASLLRTEVVAGKRVRSMDDPWIKVFNGAAVHSGTTPLPNVWLGVSVEDQKTADERIPLLLQTPAAVRFVSYEPALGPVDFARIDHRDYLRSGLVDFARWCARKEGRDEDAAATEAAKSVPAEQLPQGENPCLNALTGQSFDGWDRCETGPALDWVIVGGESGPGARPAHPGWFRSVRDQCVAAGVPFFFKQWGEWIQVELSDFPKVPCRMMDERTVDPVVMGRVGKRAAGRLLDGREWNQLPGVR